MAQKRMHYYYYDLLAKFNKYKCSRLLAFKMEKLQLPSITSDSPMIQWARVKKASMSW